MPDRNIVPVVLGLGSGIALLILFSLLSFPTQTDLEPRIAQDQAIKIVESEIKQNSWFFRVSPGTTFYVRDFEEAISIPESQFIEEKRNLPVVLIHPDGSLTNLIGKVANGLGQCKEEPGVGWCEFLTALRSAHGTRGNLAYLLVLEWDDHTEIFAIDAIDGKLLDSTIYERPILDLEEVEEELKKIGPPLIPQEEAFRLVEEDLGKRNPGEFKEVRIIGNDKQNFVAAEKFHAENMKLPLIFIHTSGTLVFVNDTSLTPGYHCDSGTMPFCGFAEPFNLYSKDRLVYGIDMISNQGPEIYAVDAVSGEIVQSSYLKSEAQED